MITVTRKRLDTGAIGVARATAHTLNLALDDRHITAAGATALQNLLNGLADPDEGQDSPPRKEPN
ncbi:hypothetical protein QZH56_13680 [Streptomyces olivoreticuli]|uniref:hypothetical protein n=1 Tax=Streptomyces olivoreticuli TaxID=68246 RepID=UPI0026583DD8|nr:hypothetical protein [Streptomyces olivoreticuli]WKK26543.1 hypothetical protein QZH56_13680 [Streptomyces olivoreticuli]